MYLPPTLAQTIKLFRKNQIAQLAVAILLTINVAALLMFVAEHQRNGGQFSSFGDSLWWSIVTIATVGYGDKVPITPAGRIVGSVTIISGLILISLFTATISSVFVARKIKESKGLQDIDFTDHILICGWNPHVEEILSIFNRYGSKASPMNIVLVNEAQAELMEVVCESVSNLDVRFVHGDCAREPVLNRAKVKSAHAALIVPDTINQTQTPSDEKTLLSLLTMKSLNPSLKVYVHIVNRENVAHIKRANADEVIVSDQFVGFFLANHILHPGLSELATDILEYGRGSDMHRVQIPSEFVGRKFEDLLLHFKRVNNWTLIGVVREEETVSLKDILSHDTSGIDAFIERKFKEAGINVSERLGMHVDVNPPSDYEIHEKDFAVIIGTIETQAS
jgi:voltage-gated potassium channel